jgi:hypothetical protein
MMKCALMCHQKGAQRYNSSYRGKGDLPSYCGVQNILHIEIGTFAPQGNRLTKHEAKCKADLDAALAALKESNRLLKRSIATQEAQSIQRQLVKVRASRWRLTFAIRQFEELKSS